MHNDDPITTLRNHLIATDGQQSTPGLKAVEIECALARGGYSILPNEAAALLAYIINNDGILWRELQRFLIDLKLAEIVPYDPAQHQGGSDDTLPRDPYLKFSDRLQGLLSHGFGHLMGTRQ
jgi:hypothetical protein